MFQESDNNQIRTKLLTTLGIPPPPPPLPAAAAAAMHGGNVRSLNRMKQLAPSSCLGNVIVREGSVKFGNDVGDEGVSSPMDWNSLSPGTPVMSDDSMSSLGSVGSVTTPSLSSLSSNDEDDTSDGSKSDAPPQTASPRTTFASTTTIIPIPLRTEYSLRHRSLMYTTPSELYLNAGRNVKEYEYEGWCVEGVMEEFVKWGGRDVHVVWKKEWERANSIVTP